jgi:hypothetical protein
MRRDIRRRLEKLESQVPRQPTEEEELVQLHRQFLRYGVAYYLGDPAPDGGREESVADAYARALGYPGSFEFRKALEANDADLNERMRLAENRLLAKFGLSWEHEWDAIVDAYKRMENGFSERYKRCWHETATRSRA